MSTTRNTRNRKSKETIATAREKAARGEAHRRAIKEFNNIFKGFGVIREAKRGKNKELIKVLNDIFNEINREDLKKY